MYCTRCGKELEAGTKFCPNCGEPVRLENRTDYTTMEDYASSNAIQVLIMKKIVPLLDYVSFHSYSLLWVLSSSL